MQTSVPIADPIFFTIFYQILALLLNEAVHKDVINSAVLYLLQAGSALFRVYLDVSDGGPITITSLMNSHTASADVQAKNVKKK